MRLRKEKVSGDRKEKVSGDILTKSRIGEE